MRKIKHDPKAQPERDKPCSKSKGRKRFRIATRYVWEKPPEWENNLHEWHRFRSYLSEKSRDKALEFLRKKELNRALKGHYVIEYRAVDPDRENLCTRCGIIYTPYKVCGICKAAALKEKSMELYDKCSRSTSSRCSCIPAGEMMEKAQELEQKAIDRHFLEVLKRV